MFASVSNNLPKTSYIKMVDIWLVASLIMTFTVVNTDSIIVVKLREREGQGVDPGRSLKGHLWMVDGGWWISFP